MLAARPAAIAAESETLAVALGDDCRQLPPVGRFCWPQAKRRLREATESSRLADRALAEAREHRARFEVLRDGANEVLLSLTREIRETGRRNAGGATGACRSCRRRNAAGSDRDVGPARSADP